MLEERREKREEDGEEENCGYYMFLAADCARMTLIQRYNGFSNLNRF